MGVETDLIRFFRVWAFCKYYHPAYVFQLACADRDFLRFAELILACKPEQNWLDLYLKHLKCCAGRVTVSAGVRTRNFKALSPFIYELFTDSELVFAREELLGLYRTRLNTSWYARSERGRLEPVFYEKTLSEIRGQKQRADLVRLLAAARVWSIFSLFSPFASSSHWQSLDMRKVVGLCLSEASEDHTRAMRLLVGALADGHARIISSEAQTAEARWLPFHMVAIDECLFVQASADPRVLVGDELIAVGGVNSSDYLSNIIEGDDKRRGEVLLRDAIRTLKRCEHQETQVVLRRGAERLSLSVRGIQRGNYWVWPCRFYPEVQQFSDITYVNMFEISGETLEAVLRERDKIIIDLRCYPKHDLFNALAAIFSHSTRIASFQVPDTLNVGRFSNVPSEVAGRAMARKTAQLRVLIDETTQSYPEYLAMGLRAYEGARLIGRATAGATGNIARFQLPDGQWVEFTGIGVRWPDLTRVLVDWQGIQPDVVVPQTLAHLQSGIDGILQTGLTDF